MRAAQHRRADEPAQAFRRFFPRVLRTMRFGSARNVGLRGTNTSRAEDTSGAEEVVGPGQRVVQLTPPGSACSIVVGEGVVPRMEPGSLRGLQLVVPDVHVAREELSRRGVEVGEVQVLGENPGRGGPLDNVGFVFFSDPDGNAWAVQQISYPR
jgi:catechol 2,3-dioxygenase-like lactoylglutathione lyase family enzyme